MNREASTNPSKPVIALAALLIGLSLAGCGNKGSLVLPADPEANTPDETAQGADTDQTEPKENP